MVISLESQNVKLKRNFYLPGFNLISKKNDIRKNRNLKLPEISYNLFYLPFFLSLIIFSFIFSRGVNPVIRRDTSYGDLNSITLPDNGADIVFKNLIESRDNYANNKHFYEDYYYKGDTLSSLATKYGVSIETILHVNKINDVNKIVEYTKLQIPNIDGFMHVVTTKDTLESLSIKYGVSIKDIFVVNDLKSENIGNLDRVYIPGINPVNYGWHSNIDSFFIYPINGFISKRYGVFTNKITGISDFYHGVDFSPIDKLDVKASKSGFVSRIGYSPSYGNYIYLDHSGGYRTLYAHIDHIDVSLHQKVAQGEIIGKLEENSNSDVVKLFFSILNRDETVNPELYLK